MSDLAELYQEMILDHGRRPRNFGEVSDPSHHAEGHNPLCGDRFVVTARVEDGVIADLQFSGSGCAISTASASLMTETLRGRPAASFPGVFAQLHDLVTGKASPDLDTLGKLAVFGGVSRFPLRVKCATLAWHTLHAALDGEESATTE